MYPFYTKKHQKAILAKAVGLALLAGNIVQASSLAATLQGVRFIDGSIATQPENVDLEPKYDVDGFIVFQPLNSPGLSPFSTPVIGGNYSKILPDGDYKVWQFVDSAVLKATQVQWANETDALEITVSGNNIAWTVSGVSIPASGIDFPFPNFTTAPPIPSVVEDACDINDATVRKIICGGIATPPNPLTCDKTYPSSSNKWPVNANDFDTNRVFVYGDITVSSGMTVKVKSLCNYGTLSSDVNGDLKIEFTDVFANFKEGNVIGANASANSGSSIRLMEKAAGVLGGTVLNEGTIKAGNGSTYIIDSSNAKTFQKSISVGGNIKIRRRRRPKSTG
ncbi:hypothetical protein QUF74_05030 [Candidatus Halobeggiatoa sp. HSG11]|nr:hypothetical protein [Candidatus Halobeggiatoa sp. HSG11]